MDDEYGFVERAKINAIADTVNQWDRARFLNECVKKGISPNFTADGMLKIIDELKQNEDYDVYVIIESCFGNEWFVRVGYHAHGHANLEPTAQCQDILEAVYRVYFIWKEYNG